MIAVVNTTQDNKESVLFQPILKAYPTCHSWMITAHVSLGNMEKTMETDHQTIEKYP